MATATDLMSELSEMATEDRLILYNFLRFLSANVLDANLSSGKRVSDVWAFEEWLKELAEEVKE